MVLQCPICHFFYGSSGAASLSQHWHNEHRTAETQPKIKRRKSSKSSGAVSAPSFEPQQMMQHPIPQMPPQLMPQMPVPSLPGPMMSNPVISSPSPALNPSPAASGSGSTMSVGWLTLAASNVHDSCNGEVKYLQRTSRVLPTIGTTTIRGICSSCQKPVLQCPICGNFYTSGGAASLSQHLHNIHHIQRNGIVQPPLQGQSQTAQPSTTSPAAPERPKPDEQASKRMKVGGKSDDEKSDTWWSAWLFSLNLTRAGENLWVWIVNTKAKPPTDRRNVFIRPS